MANGALGGDQTMAQGLETSTVRGRTSVVVSCFNKVAGDWVKPGSIVQDLQVRLPSSPSYVPGATRLARNRGTIYIRMVLVCGLSLQETARAIPELQ